MQNPLFRHLSLLVSSLLIIPIVSGCRMASVSAKAPSRDIVYGISSTAESAPTWRYSENVEFADIDDPSAITFRDGRCFSVAFDLITLDEIIEWKPGRRLRLEYQPDAGALLVDVISSRRLRLVAWPESGHPLDLRLQQLLASTPNDWDMVYDQAGRWWGIEVERAYASIAVHELATPPARAELLESAQQWQRFTAVHEMAVGAFYGSRDGSIWPQFQAEHRYRLQRNHATLVWSMFLW